MCDKQTTVQGLLGHILGTVPIRFCDFLYVGQESFVQNVTVIWEISDILARNGLVIVKIIDKHCIVQCLGMNKTIAFSWSMKKPHKMYAKVFNLHFQGPHKYSARAQDCPQEMERN